MPAQLEPEDYPDAEGQSEALRQQAERCRRLARATYDRHTNETLKKMADGFERTANGLGKKRS